MKNTLHKTIFALLLGIAAVATAARPEGGNKHFLADEVIAVVGDKMILLSDLEMALMYTRQYAGVPLMAEITPEEETRILNEMLLQKLFATKAEKDTLLTVNPVEISNNVEKRINELIQEYGSIRELERVSNKPIFMIRDEMNKQAREENLASMLQGKIQGKVIITPAEVKKMIARIPKDSLPLIATQYEYAHIVKKTPSDVAARMAVKEQLLELRNRIINGESFEALARIYSDDTNSALQGGDMGYQPIDYFTPPFADGFVPLSIGQVSNIVETEYGFHIIQLLDKKNDLYHVRHILIRPKFTIAQKNEALRELDSIAAAIRGGEVTFAEAAAKYSQDSDSKDNGGVVINNQKANNYRDLRYQSTRFFIDELRDDYAYLKDLKEGEISESFSSFDETGNTVCKIVMLIDVIPEHISNMDDDYTALVDYALGQKKKEVLTKWVKENIASTYIRLEPPYVDYDFGELDWAKKGEAE